jgi:formylglycine-generating enzyme required for sulfatase activity
MASPGNSRRLANVRTMQLPETKIRSARLGGLRSYLGSLRGRSYDVAISFVAADEVAKETASTLKDLLERRWLRVFFYENADIIQKQLGRELPSELRRIYGSDSHQVVVVASPSYGNTPFTAIEWGAISKRRSLGPDDRFLIPIATQPTAMLPPQISDLVFVSINDASKGGWSEPLTSVVTILLKRFGRSERFDAVLTYLPPLTLLVFAWAAWLTHVYTPPISAWLLQAVTCLVPVWLVAFGVIPRLRPTIIYRHTTQAVLRLYQMAYRSRTVQILSLAVVLGCEMGVFATLPTQKEESVRARQDWLSDDAAAQSKARTFYTAYDSPNSVVGEWLPVLTATPRDKVRALEMIGLMPGNIVNLEPLFGYSRDPSVRVSVLSLIPTLRLPGSELVHHFAVASSASEPTAPAIIQSYLFLLGHFDQPAACLAPLHPDCEKLTQPDRDRALGLARRLFSAHPDPGVHSAAEWLLRRWGQGSWIEAEMEELSKKRSLAACIDLFKGGQTLPQWCVEAEGHTFVIVHARLVAMGLTSQQRAGLGLSAGSYRERPPETVDRVFAISTKEVTLRQYERFLAETKMSLAEMSGKPNEGEKPPYLPDWINRINDDVAVTDVTWDAAMKYCWWSSARMGLANPRLHKEGTKESAPFREGVVRLPSEAEWLEACRAGTKTMYQAGESEENQGSFSWVWENAPPPKGEIATAREREIAMAPVGLKWPNQWGLFDMIGNAEEFCLDGGARETSGAADARLRAVCGGESRFRAKALFCACRRQRRHDVSGEGVGFRIAVTIGKLNGSR